MTYFKSTYYVFDIEPREGHIEVNGQTWSYRGESYNGGAEAQRQTALPVTSASSVQAQGTRRAQ